MDVYELRFGRGEYRIFPFLPSDDYYRRMEESKLDFSLVKTVQASSWLAAKEAFGYRLTSLQARLLSGQATHFEVFGRHGPLIGKKVEETIFINQGETV